jgi:drug/metabolite transporter (DMT)-like permease
MIKLDDIGNTLHQKLVELDHNNVPKHLFIYFIGIFIMGLATFHLKLLNMYIAVADVNTTIFFRYLLITVFSFLIMRNQDIQIPAYTEVGDTLWLTIRNVSNYCSATTLIVCFNYMRLATAIVFSALSPIFACVFSVLILKEKFHIRYIIGILICLSGSLMMILNEKTEKNIEDKSNQDTYLSNNSTLRLLSNDNNSEVNNDFMNILIGTFFGLTHSITLSLFSISTKLLINKKININIAMYYLGIFISVVSFIVGFFVNIHNEALLNPSYVFHACLSGALFYAGFQVINFAFNSKLEVLHTTSIGYVQIVESFILGALFLSETIYFSDILGCSIIIAYNILNVLFPIKT